MNSMTKLALLAGLLVQTHVVDGRTASGENGDDCTQVGTCPPQMTSSDVCSDACCDMCGGVGGFGNQMCVFEADENGWIPPPVLVDNYFDALYSNTYDGFLSCFECDPIMQDLGAQTRQNYCDALDQANPSVGEEVLGGGGSPCGSDGQGVGCASGENGDDCTQVGTCPPQMTSSDVCSDACCDICGGVGGFGNQMCVFEANENGWIPPPVPVDNYFDTLYSNTYDGFLSCFECDPIMQDLGAQTRQNYCDALDQANPSVGEEDLGGGGSPCGSDGQGEGCASGDNVDEHDEHDEHDETSCDMNLDGSSDQKVNVLDVIVLIEHILLPSE